MAKVMMMKEDKLDEEEAYEIRNKKQMEVKKWMEKKFIGKGKMQQRTRRREYKMSTQIYFSGFKDENRVAQGYVRKRQVK